MRRARKCRAVMYPPQRLVFKPAGVSGQDLEIMELTVDEYEALRLADYKEYEHEAAAEVMKISRPTFTRLIKRARQKVATFLIEGRLLEIGGGNFHFESDTDYCEDCGAYNSHKINQDTHICSECGSERLVSLAERLGHGKCCRGGEKGLKTGAENEEH